MKTTLTHIAKVRAANATQLETVCDLLNWTKEKYCKHQFFVYEELIKKLNEGLPKAEKALRYSPHFRGYFNDLWTARTKTEFLPFATDLVNDVVELDENYHLFVEPGINKGDHYLVAEYMLIHSPQRLAYDDEFTDQYMNIIDKILNDVL